MNKLAIRRKDNKGLTVKVYLWALEKYQKEEDFTGRMARLWMRGEIQRLGLKREKPKKFNDAGELISILGKWNAEKFREHKKAKK